MKILIPDTQGSRLSDRYRKLLPNVTFRGIDHADLEGVDVNPHGAWCGWLAGAPLQALGGNHEIVFLQILGPNGPVENWPDLICETIKAEKPDVVSCSWGAWDQDDKMREIFYVVGYDRYVKNLLKLKAEMGFVLVCASGNDDDNDEDIDLVYPQIMMPEQAWIIGATDPYGVPTPWSADGYVDAMMIGDRCMSPDQDGRWHLWKGTSAACPKFAGMVAANGWDDVAIRASLETLAEYPADFEGQRPHAKWGWGSMEWGWQELASRLDSAHRPPRAINAFALTYLTCLDGKFTS